jgi:hypothetical protein
MKRKKEVRRKFIPILSTEVHNFFRAGAVQGPDKPFPVVFALFAGGRKAGKRCRRSKATAFVV